VHEAQKGPGLNFPLIASAKHTKYGSIYFPTIMYATGDARSEIHVSYLSHLATVSEMSFHFNARGYGLGEVDPI
jgi:hypothetical protein